MLEVVDGCKPMGPSWSHNLGGIVLAMAVLVGACGRSSAQQVSSGGPEVAAASDETGRPMMGIGLGYFDVNGADPALHARLDYRAKPWPGPMGVWVLVEGTTHGSMGTFSGILMDRSVTPRVGLTLSTGVGAWYAGAGKELGSALEFRSAVELSYRTDDARTVGLALAHISNAGLGERNPGANIVAAVVFVPLSRTPSH